MQLYGGFPKIKDPNCPVFVTVTVWPSQIVESLIVKLAVGRPLTVIGE